MKHTPWVSRCYHCNWSRDKTKAIWHTTGLKQLVWKSHTKPCSVARDLRSYELLVDANELSRTDFIWQYIVFQQEKQICAKMSGHWRNRKVVELLPLSSWTSFFTVQFKLVVLHIRGKELPDDQHSCAGSAGLQQVSPGGSAIMPLYFHLFQCSLTIGLLIARWLLHCCCLFAESYETIDQSITQVLRSARIWEWQRKYMPS